MSEAVRLIANGTAPKITQTEFGATYDPIWRKKELAKVDFTKDALAMHNFIRYSYYHSQLFTNPISCYNPSEL